MSLPYPYEAETGQLPPRRPVPRTPFDVEGHVNDAIRARGDDSVEVFGVALRVLPPESPGPVVEHLRRGVLNHFLERVSAPDDDTWQSFASQAHEQLAGRTEVDATTLRILRLTIDAF